LGPRLWWRLAWRLGVVKEGGREERKRKPWSEEKKKKEEREKKGREKRKGKRKGKEEKKEGMKIEKISYLFFKKNCDSQFILILLLSNNKNKR
jgi:hypothetical protein